MRIIRKIFFFTGVLLLVNPSSAITNQKDSTELSPNNTAENPTDDNVIVTFWTYNDIWFPSGRDSTMYCGNIGSNRSSQYIRTDSGYWGFTVGSQTKSGGSNNRFFHITETYRRGAVVHVEKFLTLCGYGMGFCSGDIVIDERFKSHSVNFIDCCATDNSFYLKGGGAVVPSTITRSVGTIKVDEYCIHRANY